MGTLAQLFEPERVAVIGATERSGAVGGAITRNLLQSFDGDVVPVNPGAESVFGIEAPDSIKAVSDVDLAILSVPPDVVCDVLEECGRSGVRTAVVVTAGFGESGGEGATRERRLVELADKYDMAVVGPNSLGVMSTRVGLNATFGPVDALPGNISFVSQSGALVTAVVDWANDRGIGFDTVVSVGNKAVLDETDFLREWAADPETDVVIGYLEGIDDGREFIETARSVTAETPVVIAKSGRTDAGAKAVSSHTGTLAGSDRAYDVGFRQAGVLRAESVQELFDTAQLIAGQPPPSADGVAIVTNAGGPGVMATDAVGDSSLSMASFDEETTDTLASILAPAASSHNPVDVLGDATAAQFRQTMEAVLADDAVGAMVVLSAPTAVLEYDDLATAILEVVPDHDVPIVACLMGGQRVRAPRDRLTEAGIPCFFDPTRAVASLDALAEYARIRDREWERPETFAVDRTRARSILESVRTREGNRLGVEAMGLLDAYDIPTPESDIVDSAAGAERVAADIDGPVAVKIVSPDVVHKTDIGGVKVDVRPDAVRDAYEEVRTRTHNYYPDARILGVQIQEMVDLDSGVETIVGMNRVPQFGPLLLFGLGGIFVEVLEDTSVRVAPVSAREAREMTTEVRSAPLLRGARGREPADVDGVVEVIQRLSQLVTDFPAIVELDVNPLVALPAGVSAIDVRLTVDPTEL